MKSLCPVPWKADSLFNKTPMYRTGLAAGHGGFLYLVVAVTEFFPEQERCAPQTGQANNGVDDSAEQGILTAEDPSHKVKLENTNKTPVDTANDRQDQRKHIDHDLFPPFYIG